MAKYPNSNLVATLAAVELDAGAVVDEEEGADEVAVLAAVLVEARGVEEVMVTRLDDPASGVLTRTELEVAETVYEAPTSEEPEGTWVLRGTGVETGMTETTEEDEAAAAQVESAVSLTLTHWVTESLSVV